jgi:hypothetical protein
MVIWHTSQFCRTYKTSMKTLAAQIISFYINGFRRMKLGRTLWVIILIKLLIIFGVLKLFFFPDYLHDNFKNDIERADHVFTNLTQISNQK